MEFSIRVGRFSYQVTDCEAAPYNPQVCEPETDDGVVPNYACRNRYEKSCQLSDWACRVMGSGVSYFQYSTYKGLIPLKR